MNIKRQILTSIFLLLSLLHSEIEPIWQMHIDAENADDNIAGDWITMGYCDECSDGFHWGEEDLDDGIWGGINLTNIYFQHMDWFIDGQVNGLVDENNNPPTSGFYEQEFKSTHPPEDLLLWDISGACASGVEDYFFLNWSVNTIDEEYNDCGTDELCPEDEGYIEPDEDGSEGNSEYDNGEEYTDSNGNGNYDEGYILDSEYNIYLYVDGEAPTNMRSVNWKQIDCDKLPYETIAINDSTYYWDSKINILIGGCAGTPLSTYYEDLDGDGWGSNVPSEFCNGYQTDGWVSNSQDLDDSIYCESNNIDSCNVCDGNNQDLDCNNVCFGDFEEDMCGICDNDSSNDCEQDCSGIWGGDAELDCANECQGSAVIDDCDICSGGIAEHIFNSDQDCNGDCFGSAFIDYCEDCDGFNSGCLDLVFGDGPSDLYAQINSGIDEIELSWIYTDINISDQIVGYKIYKQIENNNLLIGVIESLEPFSYIILDYTSGIFCLSAYDLYENETDLICAEASEFSNFSFMLHDGANLISFPYISNNEDDTNLETIFNSIEGFINGVIGEGVAASYTQDEEWIGNINEIERRSGYWLNLDIDDDDDGIINCEDENCIYFSVAGIETNHNIVYTIHEGANLISYVGPNGIPIGDAIPDDIEPLFEGIIGEGMAASQSPESGWVGNLSHLYIGKGYWIKIDGDSPSFNLIWNADNTSFLSRPNGKNIKNIIPDDFKYNQSSRQAFYFVKDIKLNSATIDEEDVIISYCNGIMVGSRFINSDYTDIPAMGYEGNKTIGYCDNHTVPEFKLYDNETENLITLVGENIPKWENLGIFFISLKESSNTVPYHTKIISTYPNPFNPSTTINFSIEELELTQLSIIDINGKVVSNLINEKLNQGNYNIIWNSGNNPSGIYFVRLISGKEIQTAKIFLIK